MFCKGENICGDMPDGKTVPEKMQEVQEKYGTKDVVLAGDREMISRANYEVDVICT
jgi:transposase